MIDYGDRVNVLVHTKGTKEEEKEEPGGRFVVLEQTKYALEGSSLAAVGGFIERNEAPISAAVREVREELQIQCDVSKAVALGKYRTDVNRGLGWVHAFLVRDCVSEKELSGGEEAIKAVRNNIADADSKQELQTMRRLTLPQVEEAALSGKFVEVQWSNTVSLAMLYLKKEEHIGVINAIKR